jgi:NAD(P)-dependent dehydrogenase (short-subunit alcohol dehydrogenase family)
MRLDGKRALITGSTRGIGRATAERFAAEGAAVILHGRRQADVDAAVRALNSAGPRAAIGIAADLADRAQCRDLAGAAGEVDILVNCAGVYEGRPIAACDSALWEWTMGVNLTAPWLLAQALLPGLRRRRGVVVNVASDSALLGYANDTIYCASKGALVGLTRALAVELAPAVRAVAVCPGPVDTDMARESFARTADPAATRKAWESYPLLGRLASPEEVADVILFAAAPEAAYVTGAVIAVDGGSSAGKRIP